MPLGKREISSGNQEKSQHPLLNQRSDSINEIISREPSFIGKWSLVLFISIIILVIGISWFIEYPDLIQTKATLLSINAPKPILVKTDGKLIRVLVKEGDWVNQGSLMGYLESTAKTEEVLALSKKLDLLINLKEDKEKDIMNQFLHTPSKDLGELQQDYQIFAQALVTYSNYTREGYLYKKSGLLKTDISNLIRLHKNLLEQITLEKEDLALAQTTFEANDTLQKNKVISALEFRNEQSKLLSKKLSLPQLNASLITNETEQNEKQKEILELDNSLNQAKTIFIQAILSLKSRIAEWKKKFVFEAPIEGKIAFARFLQTNIAMKTGETFCFINPGNTSYFAEMVIPQSNFGKVKLGEKVLLRLPSYPSQEYGFLEGKIQNISSITSDSGYLARVSLNHGMVTNYKKIINYRDGLTANAQIITKNLRLLERFYYNFNKQIQR